MIDINFIREHPDKVRWALEIKKISLDIDEFLHIDKKRNAALRELEELQRKRNEIAASGRTGNLNQREEGKLIKQKLGEQEKRFETLDEIYENFMVQMPTIPAADTPIGNDERGNVEVKKWGEPSQFSFTPKDHVQIGRDLDLLDLEKGVKVSGYRGYYVKNEAVMLQMGVMMYALQKAIQKGFKPMIPPTLVNEFVLFGSGYFKGKTYNPDTDEIYKIDNNEKEANGAVKKENKFLVGTAEPSLLAYYADDILKEKDLPLKICGFSQCYRSEIGSYGKDTKGIYRVHEFMKVELVCITKADVDTADSLHEELIAFSRELHEDLGLPYRQLRICSGDLSAGKYKQFDTEAWIPSRQAYGETGSASNFLDWQSRRLNVRYRTDDGDIKYVYMLNDTALPSPRILISILENYQQADGSIKVPEALLPYMNGIHTIHRGSV
ncbi:MAG: serine--tRNA ligase [Patescibacteria group bacterium]